MLTHQEMALLRILNQSSVPMGSPLNVEQLSRKAKISRGRVSQILGRLARHSLVDRRSLPTRNGRSVYYRPSAWVSVQWSSPAEGVLHEWHGSGEIDWTYPLVSQVPDSDARQTVRMFLERLRMRNLLDAPKKGRAEFRGLSLVVYGSSARGQARPGSDVDVVGFFLDDHHKNASMILDIAAEVSLEAPRAVHLMLLHWDRSVVNRARPIVESWQREGLVVHDGLRKAPGGESAGVWRFVMRGRAIE